MTTNERYRMVVDAVFFGTRPTARVYGVTASTVHHWLHHPDYEGLVALCRSQRDRLVRDLRMGEAVTS